MTPTQEKIANIKANIAELEQQLKALEAEDGKVASFAESEAIRDIGLDPLTVAKVVAAWEEHKVGKAVEALEAELLAEPVEKK